MRWRGVCHVEFAVVDYDESLKFYDAMLGWLGYSSFSSLNMEYQSVYYMTRNHVAPHSYIGIQPASSGEKLVHSEQVLSARRRAPCHGALGEVSDVCLAGDLTATATGEAPCHDRG